MVYQFQNSGGESLKREQANPGALPVYVQLSELLIRDIAAGRLVDGSRLPPERAMAADLNVAVGTLRKALALLEKKGLLERIQGSGNYIRHNPGVDSIYSMFRLELPGGGGLPRAELVDVSACQKPGHLPPFGASASATRIRRIRALNDVRVAAEDIWLDGSAGTLERNSVTESLYQTYRKALGLIVTRAEDRVCVAPCPDWAAAHIGLAAGDPVGLVERLAWASAPHPIEFSRTWFNSDRAHYVQRLK